MTEAAAAGMREKAEERIDRRGRSGPANPPVTLRGEAALLLVVVMNSFGVVLMLHSGSGISAISSVPYGFSEAFPVLSLGTWTYLFQGLLVLSLFVMRRRFVPQYLFSFVVGFVFGVFVDIHECWVSLLRVLYFLVSYLCICFGIALSNRCRMPIVPTDLFPREASGILGVRYSVFKIVFDVSCLAITALLTFFCLGDIDGLGVGTILAAFTMGKVIGLMGDWLDRKVRFVSVLSEKDRRGGGQA